jgi:hypothetical protein
MKKIIYLSTLFFLFSCSPKSNDSANSNESSSTEANINNESGSSEESLNTDVISDNRTAENPTAQNEEPKFKFKETEFDFGTITDGEKVSHTFRFTNVGNADLVITSATASCGCTVPKHSKEPIAPGKTGEIEVTFNSEGKGSGVSITKDVTIIANTNPVQTILQIKAIVLAKK